MRKIWLTAELREMWIYKTGAGGAAERVRVLRGDAGTWSGR